MDFEGVGAVFEFVVCAVDGSWEFAGFSNWDEAGGECLCDGDAEDEAAGLGSDDEVDAFASVGVGHEFDGQCESAGVCEEWCEVFVDDAGLWEVWDILDEGFEAGDGVGVHLGLRGYGLWRMMVLMVFGLVRWGVYWYDDLRDSADPEPPHPGLKPCTFHPCVHSLRLIFRLVSMMRSGIWRV